MMDPNEDLPSLIQNKDNLGVLRYIRAHALREPKLVVSHGQALLGEDRFIEILRQSIYCTQSDEIAIS